MDTVVQVDTQGNARVITLLSVKVQAAWPFYTLTDEDRAQHWDGAVNDAGTKGGRIPLCSPALTGKPESVRGTVRKLFASSLPCLVPGLYIVQPGKEAEAQALIQQAEQLVQQADSDMAAQWSAEFPDWWDNANELARHGCQARGFDKPQPYWVRLKAHLFTAEGLSEAESEALAKDAEAETLQQEQEELDRWQRVWAGKNAMTATAFRDLSSILNKAGSPAAGALVVPNGKKGAALDPQVTAQTLGALCPMLTREEWQTLMPVLIRHCPTQAQPEPEQDEPEEAQAEPQPEPEQTQPETLPEPPEEVRVDVEDSDFMPPADEAVASLTQPEPETKPEPEPEPEIKSDVQSCIDEDGDFIPD